MKIHVQLNFSLGYKWHESNNIYVKGYLFDALDNLYANENLIDYFKGVKTEEQFNAKLNDANGIFSVIIIRDKNAFFAVDRIRTFPLFYVYDQEQLIISDDTNYLKEFLSLSLNQKSIAEFISAGFVTGRDTLIERTYQIQAGEYLVWSNCKIKNNIYYSYLVNQSEISTDDEKSLRQQFLSILDKVVDRMIKIANGRQLVVPLSGGFDSRLIVSLLKKKKYENVICFTYGSKDSFEVKISQNVASRLKYQWYFVEYNSETIAKDYNQCDEFTRYYKFAVNNVANFLLQDYFAIKYLHENKCILHNAIIIPGHSGDFLGGSHLRNGLVVTKNNISNSILVKHYSLSDYNQDMKEKVFNYVKGVGNSYLPYSINENFNMKERQSKFIVNANRIYEYFGYEHIIPLWDKELTEFFRVLPLQFKIKKNTMYNSTLFNCVFNDLNIIYKEDFPTKIKGIVEIESLMKKIIKIFLPKSVKEIYFKRKYFDFNCFSLMANVLLKDLNESIHHSNINLIIAKWYIHKLNRNLK